MKKLLLLFGILSAFAVSAQKRDSLPQALDSMMKQKQVKNSPLIPVSASSVNMRRATYVVSTDSFRIVVADRYDPVMEQRKRDTTAPVIIRRDTIYQGGKAIGYFASGYPVPPGTRQVLLPGGMRIASVQMKDDNLMMISTVRDRKPHYLTKDGYYEQQIADFLVQRGYL